MKKDEYILGNCHKCRQYKALRNGYCFECKNEELLPNFLKGIFQNFKKKYQ